MLNLQDLKDMFGHLLGKGGEPMQELEVSIRAKGNVTREEDVTLRGCVLFANAAFVLADAVSSIGCWFTTSPVFTRSPPLPRLLRFGMSAGAGLIAGRATYHATLHTCALLILHSGEDRLKMELAHIILTKHSDEKSLVEAVKRHFFTEHLFSDQHQDKPLFRWHQRHSYVDSTYMERVKEIEANNSEDEIEANNSEDEIEANNSEDKTKTISGRTTRSFGDLMEDPLACILGSPDSKMESDKPPEHTATILRRRDLRAQRRSHRHHHRHATL